MNRLENAIEAFGDESSDLTLGERVSLLRQALMWNAYDTIKMINKYGKKHKISEEEAYKQEQCMEYFKILEKMYASEVRMNRLMGKNEDKLNDDFLKVIRDMKSSVGSIVRDLKDGTNG